MPGWQDWAGGPTSSTPDPQLVDTFRRIRQDSRSDPKPTEVAQPFTITMTFDGVSTAPTVGDSFTLPLGRISGRIVGATMVADGAATAQIDVRLGNTLSWPTVSPIYDTAPSLAGAYIATIDTSNWKVNIQPGDILYCALPVASGTFTSVTLSLECIRLKWPSGSAGIADSGGNTLIDTGGDAVVQRN